MKPQLLIIEDELQIRENLAELLTLQGFSVEAAADGRAGIIQAMQSQPDLILCDVMMPELDGYQVLEAIRTDRALRTVPFIFLTAKAEAIDLRRGMSLGADDYLFKPFTNEDLVQAIESRLQREKNRASDLQFQLDRYLANLGRVSLHEHNTPLAGIMGLINLMKDGLGSFDKDETQSMLEMMMVCSLRLKRTLDNERLTNQLIRLDSRSAAYESFSTGSSMVFEPLVQQIYKSIRREHELKLSAQITVAAAPIQISAQNLTKILEELIDNAIKFSVPRCEIEVTGQQTEKQYILTVTNWGREFKAEDIAYIAPYTQFDRLYYEQQGSGLGLFIAKKLVELNRGQLTIASSASGPTQVTVRLPLTVET
ncbi:response regulator [Spirosoma taeanense]|uniref:histidine kinase n=1 Tax=Spirosoma taeanense TaxID=2735870 RepID=A0A6M5Y9D8_9BACT|nr:response regulator [Spirosoma taeanense]QJW89986.1 response regulator [Spirosoma taeanense]